MDYIVTITVKYPASAVNPEDAGTTIPYMVKVRSPKGYPSMEATAEITETKSGKVTKLALQ